MGGPILAFVVGVCFFQRLPSMPLIPSILVLTAITSLVAWRLPSFRLPFWLVFGFCWAWFQASLILDQRIDPGLAGKDLLVTGIVTSLPDLNADRSRFEFDVETTYDAKEIPFAGRVRLSWYRPTEEIQAGQRWQFLVRLKPVHGFRNPAGFDYESWLFQRGIGATGYIRSSLQNQKLEDLVPSGIITRFRQEIREKLLSVLQNHPGSGLLLALTIGDRGGLSRGDWRAFTRTGTNHLVAISGLHIGVVSGIIMLLMRSLWLRQAYLIERWPAQQAAAVAGLVAAFLYAALAGFSTPTSRALIMLIAALGGLLMKRGLQPAQALLLALGLIVMLDPLSVMSSGFWMSFLAVGAIVYGASRRCVTRSNWKTWILPQWIVFVGLLPVIPFFFGYFSVVALLVNLFAVPWFTLVMVPLVLVATGITLLLPIASHLLIACADLLVATQQVLSWCARPAWASVSIPAQAIGVWFTAGIGVVLLISPRGLPGRFLGLLLVVPLAQFRPTPPDPDSFRLTLLDVGQGLAVVVQTANHVMVYDAGPQYSSEFDAGSGVIVPYLRSLGIRHINHLVISHGDKDHAGGAEGIKSEIAIDQVFSGEPERLFRFSAQTCQAGTSWIWDGVLFSFLHPHQKTAEKGNNASCVLLVRGPGGALLLTGDIEQTIERRLVEDYSGLLAVDVVVAPHHGSRSSSTNALVEATSPKLVLVSAGFINQYGFPDQAVMGRWEAVGARILNTAEEGAVTVRISPTEQAIRIDTERRRSRRYWDRVCATDCRRVPTLKLQYD